MKNIIIALAIVGFTSYNADAQKVACGKPEGKVCKKSANGTSCYKTQYAQNFKVCKSEYGYFICCQEPNATNSTFPKLPIASNTYDGDNQQAYAAQTGREQDEIDQAMIPQSQSYPTYSANSIVSYAGYYPSNTKGKIRVCSNTNNVAEANKDAYNGCPTPAYDGPQKNKRRNVNVANPNSSFPTPPNSGNPQY